MPSRIRPRSWKPQSVAGTDVSMRTACSSVNACFVRTQWESRCVWSERIHELGDVRARVRERRDRARVAHDLERDVLVLVGDGLQEEEVEVLLEREVDHGLGRMLACARARPPPPSGAAPPPCRTRRASRSRPAAPRCRAALRPSRSPEASIELAAQLGIAQLAASARRSAARGCSFHTRQPVERHLGLEREQRAERAAVRLREHASARGRGLVEQVEVLPPDVRRRRAG